MPKLHIESVHISSTVLWAGYLSNLNSFKSTKQLHYKMILGTILCCMYHLLAESTKICNATAF